MELLLSLRNFPFLKYRNCFPKFAKWIFEKLGFPKLKVLLLQICLMELLFEFEELPFPKYAKCNFIFEFEKLSFPKLIVML